MAPSSINRSLPPAVDALVARALRKNPNERFPSAEAMRDECLRVAASFTAAAPSIVPGAQTSNGAGVGSAVFPPVDLSAPAPTGPVQSPYQPGPYGGPAPAPVPAYGYPQQGGYQTPPQTAAYAPQHSTATPPPYNITPQPPTPALGGSGGQKSNRALIIGSVVVALVAIGGLIAALTLHSNSKSNSGSKGKGSRAGASSTVVAGHKDPDTTKTIETTKCTEPQESYDDPKKIRVPDFSFKNLTSVKACFQAAGWKYKVDRVDENTYGKDTVMDQYPRAGEDADPKSMPEIDLKVSTGNPA